MHEISAYFARLQRALVNHWLSGLAILLVMGVAITLQVLSKPKVYQSVCKLEFAQDFPNMSLDRQGIVRSSSYVLQNLFLNSQRIIILSDPVISRVAERLAGGKNRGPKYESLKAQVKGALSIERVSESQIFLLTAKHPDAKVATDIANVTAEVYLRHNYEKKINNFRTSMEWLDEELADLKAKLEVSQRKLIEFIEREGFTDSTNPGDQRAFYSQEIFLESERLLEDLNRQKLDQELILARLDEKYLPAHPKYQKVLQEVKLLKEKISEETVRLNQNKDLRKKKLIGEKKNEIEYSILKRDVEINKEVYNTLVRKHKEVDIGTAVARTDATIIEQARVPMAAVYPNKKLQITLGWILSLLFGLGYCVLREVLDFTIKSPKDLEETITEPLLGVIPVGTNAENDSDLCSFISDSVRDAESFRVLRVNLNFSFPKEQNGRIIMVGSPNRNEGKSTVSFNLAAVTAESGKRTLLVDGDLRARNVSKYFGMMREPGLTNVVVGENRLDDVVVQTEHDNLWLLPAGPVPPKPSTLIESDAMYNLIHLIRDQFDEIIIDSPPINVVIDGSLVAALADSVMLVVNAGSTHKAEIRTAIKSIRQAQGRIAGVVLNRFKSGKRDGYYGYGSYYGHYGEAQAQAISVPKNSISSKELE